jgi:hypothetical protein
MIGVSAHLHRFEVFGKRRFTASPAFSRRGTLLDLQHVLGDLRPLLQ